MTKATKIHTQVKISRCGDAFLKEKSSEIKNYDRKYKKIFFSSKNFKIKGCCTLSRVYQNYVNLEKRVNIRIIAERENMKKERSSFLSNWSRIFGKQN